VSRPADCPLCRDSGGEVLWQDAQNRIVWAPQPDQPGLCRVIAQRHVREMSDLDRDARARVMDAVMALEEALREVVVPDKINLASFGNVVPHLHWHVIPRYEDDAFFPNAIWGERVHDGAARALPDGFALLMRAALLARLGEPRL